MFVYAANMEMIVTISTPCISPCFSGYLAGAETVESKS